MYICRDVYLEIQMYVSLYHSLSVYTLIIYINTHTYIYMLLLLNLRL